MNKKLFGVMLAGAALVTLVALRPVRLSYVMAAIPFLAAALAVWRWSPWLSRITQGMRIGSEWQEEVKIRQVSAPTQSILIDAFLACFCFFYQSVILLRDKAIGFLSIPVRYDECFYLLKGIYAIDDVMNGSNLYDVFKKFDLHAPLANFLVFVSLAVSDLNVMAPYYINFVFPAFLLIYCNHYLNNLSFFNRIPLFVLIISTPFLCDDQFIYLKSDLKGIILFSVFLLMLFDENSLKNKKSSLITLVVLTGMVKITNISFIAVFGYSFFIYCICSCLIDDSSRLEFRQNCMISARIIFSSILIILLIMYPSRIYISRYIRYALGPVWYDDYPLFKRFLYYFKDANFFNYKFGLFLLALIVAFLLFSHKRRKHIFYSGALLSICFIAIIPVVAIKMVNISFAYLFFGSVAATIIYIYRMVLSGISSSFRTDLGVILLLLCALTPFVKGNHYSFPSEYRNELNEMLESVVMEVCREEKSNLLLTYTSGELPTPNYAIHSYFLYKKKLQTHDIRHETDDMFAKMTSEFSHILVREKSSKDYWNFNERFPSTKKQEFYFDVLTNSDNHAPIRTFTIKNDVYHLFRTKNVKAL